MLMQVTNLLSTQLNYLDYYYGYPGSPPVTNAIGGNLVNPVPYPFDWYQPFPANGVTGYNPTFAVHPEDWGFVHPNFGPQKVSTLWNILVQAGTVSIAFSAETTVSGFGDQSERFFAAV